MKIKSFLIWFHLLMFSFRAAAQYSTGWSTIDGGGGTSAGGQYWICGTIGQPDAGSTMSNGPYAVTGGFWAFAAAVQRPEAPVLTIVLSGAGRVTISWTPSTSGWVLEETVSLSGTWTNSVSGATNPVVVPAALPAKFYRLRKP